MHDRVAHALTASGERLEQFHLRLCYRRKADRLSLHSRYMGEDGAGMKKGLQAEAGNPFHLLHIRWGG